MNFVGHLNPTPFLRHYGPAVAMVSLTFALPLAQKVDEIMRRQKCGLDEAFYQAINGYKNFFERIFSKPVKDEARAKEEFEEGFKNMLGGIIDVMIKTKQSLNVLGLTEQDFTREKCRKAFHSLALQYHPDKPDGSLEKMLKLREAFEHLECNARPISILSSSTDQNGQRALSDK